MKFVRIKYYFFSLILILVSHAFAQDTDVQTIDPAESTQPPSPKESKTNAGGLFIEPFLLYETAEVEIDYPAPFSSSTESVDGFGIGARFGMHVYDIIFLCADGRFSLPQYDSSALSGKADAKAYNLGATAGVQTPLFGLRVWGTYIFTGNLDPETINNVDIKFEELQGYRLGVGLYVAMVSINLEYQDATYDKTVLQELGPITSGAESSIEAESKSLILSLSFPIAI